MSKIRFEEILGMKRDGEIICSECMSEEECASLREHEIISREEIEMEWEIFFCDRCGARIFSPRLLNKKVKKIEKPIFEK